MGNQSFESRKARSTGDAKRIQCYGSKALFRDPVLSKPDVPVLLEAFHYRFHPSWQTFISLFDPKDVEEAEVINWMFAGMLPHPFQV